jgi:hypothetical protein
MDIGQDACLGTSALAVSKLSHADSIAIILVILWVEGFC